MLTNDPKNPSYYSVGLSKDRLFGWPVPKAEGKEESGPFKTTNPLEAFQHVERLLAAYPGEEVYIGVAEAMREPHTLLRLTWELRQKDEEQPNRTALPKFSLLVLLAHILPAEKLEELRDATQEPQ